jgi:hypothetical protein
MTLLAAIRAEATELAQWASYAKGRCGMSVYTLAVSLRTEWPSYRGKAVDVETIERAIRHYADIECRKVWAK